MADTTAFQLAITGQLDNYAKLREDALARADTRAMQRTVDGVKTAGRRVIINAGLGQRLANALRSTTDPRRGKPPKLNPRGVVFSKAGTKKRPGGPVDVITAHRTGAVIKGKLYLRVDKTIPRDPRQYGGATYTVKKTRGRGRPSKNGETLGYVFDRDSKKLLYVIRSGVTLKASLKGIDRVFARAPQQLEERRHREYETEFNRIARQGVKTTRSA